MELSPWGWYLPMVSPTILADFLWGLSDRMPSSFMEYRVLLWTGFRPSRISGRALATITLMA